MGVVTSRQNQFVKLARSVRSRKARDTLGLFLAEGIRLAVAAAKAGVQAELVFTCPDLLRSDIGRHAAAALVDAGAKQVEVSTQVFHSFAGRENPTGIAIIARSRFTSIENLDPSRGLCRVALLSPQDPGNVGAILRTCDAVGAAGILLVENAVDPYDPRAVRAGMGSIFNQEICRCSRDQLLEWSSHGVMSVAVSGDASSSYRSLRYGHPLVLIMGSEREGLDRALPSDNRVRIPMCGTVDSLNLATAAALVLYEVFAQSDQ